MTSVCLMCVQLKNNADVMQFIYFRCIYKIYIKINYRKSVSISLERKHSVGITSVSQSSSHLSII